MPRLSGVVVVVTGASSGLGWHLALGAARRGARVVAVARRLERLEALEAAIGAAGCPAPLVVQADIGDLAQVESLGRRVEEECGGAQVLINNAGRGAHGRLEDLPAGVVDRVLATNLGGALHCTRVFLPQLKRHRPGHLVFVSSVLGELPAAEHAVYCATKFALNGLAESLDCELQGSGVGVTLVEPGLVDTEFALVSGRPPGRFSRLPASGADQVAERILRAVEGGRFRLIPDRLAWVGIAFRRHFPRSARLFFRAAFRRLLRESQLKVR
ncbi:MAG: SDR family NAD(P)-dependent oxidoreductase [Candidatus Handelsmanbacteria bacterium]|nr:SDR family NAD(P)-dependent oxidoreductase [Candidatus Handelsmanbacteria bacterium]